MKLKDLNYVVSMNTNQHGIVLVQRKPEVSETEQPRNRCTHTLPSDDRQRFQDKRKAFFSTNGAGTIVYPCAKE